MGAVSNSAFSQEWENKDNQKVLRAVLSKYSHLIPDDCLESCAMTGVWKAIQSHDCSYNTKFTSSVYRFVKWECQSEARRRKRIIKTKPLKNENVISIEEEPECTTLRGELDEYIDRLPKEWQRTIVRQYYFEQKSMSEIGKLNGYSKETARNKINAAVAELRNGVYSNKPLQENSYERSSD